MTCTAHYDHDLHRTLVLHARACTNAHMHAASHMACMMSSFAKSAISIYLYI